MVDLRFATPVELKKFACAACPDATQKGRRCHSPGYENLKKPMHVGSGSLAYSFCPGKATWDLELAELFDACRVTLETGIMPKGPNLDDQDSHFAAALPTFIDRWKGRSYQKVWADVGEYASMVLMALFPGK